MTLWTEEQYEEGELKSVNICPSEIELIIDLKLSDYINYCSEASAQMILNYYGIQIEQYTIHSEGYYTYENMGPLFDKYLNYVTYIPKDDTPLETGRQLHFIRTHLSQKHPIIIRYKLDDIGNMHTIVVKGYEDEGFLLIVNDPDSGVTGIDWDVDINNITGMMAFIDKK